MKILVCISHVPDTTSKINFTDSDTKFDVQGVQFVINPNDEFGLTRAMWLKEKEGASIDVINVGNQSSESTLSAFPVEANSCSTMSSSFFVTLGEDVNTVIPFPIIAGRLGIDRTIFFV